MSLGNKELHMKGANVFDWIFAALVAVAVATATLYVAVVSR
jgi:hypothetical protein